MQSWYPIPVASVRHTGCQWVPRESETVVPGDARPDVVDPEIKAPKAPPLAPACQPGPDAPKI